MMTLIQSLADGLASSREGKEPIDSILDVTKELPFEKR